MKSTLTLTEEDIANAVAAWVLKGGYEADANTFSISVQKADRPFDSDYIYATINVDLPLK